LFRIIFHSFGAEVVYTVDRMLLLSSSLLNQSVMSLRTGGDIAVTREFIINPNNLKIEGFYCDDRFEKEQLVLLNQDIRDLIKQGFVVDDHEVLARPDELVRLKSVIKLAFTLIGKPVVTVTKQKLGKVSDFAVDDATLFVQKIYVGQSLLKSISGGTLSIDRSQIVEITDKKIIVQDPLKGVKAGSPMTATPAA
jgi:sporulation protein YlmC with PRC-barrel domain